MSPSASESTPTSVTALDSPTSEEVEQSWLDGWRRWHAQRNATLSDPQGWLGLTELHWLTEVPVAIEGLPGSWSVAYQTVVHQDASEATVLTPHEGAPGVKLDFAPVTAEVIRRTGKFAVRIHDPNAAAIAAFNSIPVFDPDPAWRIPATFIAYPAARQVSTGAVVEGLEHHHRAVGTLLFRHDGADHTLTAFGDPAFGDSAQSPELRVLFADKTNGLSTHPAVRILHVDTSSGNTTSGHTNVYLDFNRAQNLPCAFTDAATCPIAPAENRLTFAVEAGEQDPKRGATDNEGTR